MGDTEVKDEVERLLTVPPGTFWIHRDGGPAVKVRGMTFMQNEKRWKIVYHTVAGGAGYCCELIHFLDQWSLLIDPATLKPPTSCHEVHKLVGYSS